MPYRDLSDGQILAAAGGFATICGWLSYLLKVQEGKAFTWRGVFAPWSDQCCMWADQLRGAFLRRVPAAVVWGLERHGWVGRHAGDPSS